jgi:DNA ligase-associated metallophosphoesterase
MLGIQLCGEEIFLLPEKALWWPAQQTLILSDVHWGKSGHFRKHGIAVPLGSQQQDEQKLSGLIHSLAPHRLIFAGDLFHSSHNKEIDTFGDWRKAHSNLHIDLVAGNHDILPEDFFASWNVMLYRETLLLSPFLIAHDDVREAGFFTIHGHVHPGIKIYGKGRQSMALSCFCEEKNRLILPAFGSFTGRYYVEADQFNHVYVVAENIVLQWK